MVTGCGCHDPAVFGHGDRCPDRLGSPNPRWPGLTELREDSALTARLAQLAETPMPAEEWRTKSARIIRRYSLTRRVH